MLRLNTIMGLQFVSINGSTKKRTIHKAEMLAAIGNRLYAKAARNLDTIQKIVHAIIAYTARKKLPDEISCSKEKMKTPFKSLMTMASFNIGFALSMMAL